MKLLFLLLSLQGIGQVKLDTLKFKIETVTINPLETKFILTNNQELRSEKVDQKRYFILETFSKIESFSINKNGELLDTFIRVQKSEYLDSTFILLVDQKMKLLKRFGKKELGLVVNFSKKEKNYTFFENSRPSLNGIAVLINGELKTKEINYFPNGNRSSVRDKILERDTFYYDNGKISSIVDNVLNSEKDFDNKNFKLTRFKYKVEVKNDYVNFETYTDYYLNNKITERKIIRFENQTTTLKYKNNKMFEKEIVTFKNNGDRIIEIYDGRGKKIKESLEPNNAVTPIPDNN